MTRQEQWLHLDKFRRKLTLKTQVKKKVSKLLKVNNADLLHEYNHDCRKLGGFKNPGLEFCPAFENGENSCTVSIFHCNADF